MTVSNPFSITYGSRTLGGSSTSYLLHGPYVQDKRFDSFRLVFDVVVVSSSHAGLHALCESLEDDMRKRDQDLTIKIGTERWDYVHGETLLNSQASISKPGDPETDAGFSRKYTIIVEGELPADDTDGLRDLEVLVTYEPSRQKLVTMRGVYTATEDGLAKAQYVSEFDAEQATRLAAIDGSATFELVHEEHQEDRNNHTCSFTRQLVQLLAPQSQSGTDDAQIRDHRVTFTDTSQHPGDSAENIYRLRRVVGSYDCALDIEQTTDLQTVFEQKVRGHLIQLFESNFAPSVFCLEDKRVSYDETSKRMSVVFQFLYQASGGSAVVEVGQSLAYQEQRSADRTPVHSDGEFAAHVDKGFASRLRVATRTVIVLGQETPKRRIGVDPENGPAGPIVGIEGGAEVVASGWNIISNVSRVTDRYVGDPGHDQIRLTVLSENVVEEYNEAPDGRTAVPQ